MTPNWMTENLDKQLLEPNVYSLSYSLYSMSQKLTDNTIAMYMHVYYVCIISAKCLSLSLHAPICFCKIRKKFSFWSVPLLKKHTQNKPMPKIETKQDSKMQPCDTRCPIGFWKAFAPIFFLCVFPAVYQPFLNSNRDNFT